jgi:hypothetical protein
MIAVAAFSFAGAAMAIEVKPPAGFYAEFTIPDYFHGTWCAKGKQSGATKTYTRCGAANKNRVVIEEKKITRYDGGEPNNYYGDVIGILPDEATSDGWFVAVKSGAYGGKNIVRLRGGLTGPSPLPTDVLTIENVKSE